MLVVKLKVLIMEILDWKLEVKLVPEIGTI